MKKYFFLGSFFIIGIMLAGNGCSKLNETTPPGNTASNTVSTPSITTSTDSNPVNRRYKANGPDVCARIKFACEPGEHYFSDAGGCGCELDDTTVPPTDNPPKDQTFCTMEYKPVCGEKTVYCIRAPCPPVKQTYGNRCEAEKDDAKNIVEGACPEK